MKKLILTAMVTVAALQATPLYNGCAGCHGTKAEKSAMGKSKIINSMSKQEIVTALKGYKAGTYGGVMKAVMKGQAMRLSEADMQTVANYIATLK